MQHLAERLKAQGVPNADEIARSIAANMPPIFDETDLRAAFQAGWKERNKSPGLKRQARRNLDNAIMSAIGGGRHLAQDYVPDTRTYHASIWSTSDYRKKLKRQTEPTW